MRRSGQVDYDSGDVCRDHPPGGRDNPTRGMRHHIPLDHFRPTTSLDLYRANTSHSSSQGDLYRVSSSMAPSYHVCTSTADGFRPISTGGGGGGHSFHHSPGCPHTTHSSNVGASSHDAFRNFPGDMCRGLSGSSSHGYSDSGRSMEHHHDPYHRHPSPQEGSRSELYRDIGPMGHNPHHHHHHHPHHHHQPHQPHHPHHLVRHTSNIDRHTIERHRANLESRGVLETRHEYDSDDPLERLVEHPVHHHFTQRPAEVLRHHRSVPDMYARLQEEERAEQQRQQSEQHTYGEGCRLRRQQSLSKDTAMSGGSASSDPPPPPSSHRARLAGLHRQHSLGTELSRSSYSHDLISPPPESRHPQQDMTRSQSSALDLARTGSMGVLGHSTFDIRRSRSNVQDMCRNSRPSSETRELRHAHSTHELPRSHSPRSRSPRHHTPLPDVYPDHPRASSGGSSGPSPPLPSGPPSDPGQDSFPRQHSAHCEMSRVARQQQQQQNYYHTALPPQQSRVSGQVPHRGSVPHGRHTTNQQFLHPAYRGHATTTMSSEPAQHNSATIHHNGPLKVSD